MMRKSAHSFVLLLLLCLPVLLTAQSVFVKAYDPLIHDPLIERDGDHLLIAGSSKVSNLSWDFAMVKVDTNGTVLQQFTYDHDFVDELKFIKRVRNNGYIFGGHSWPAGAAGINRHPDSAKIVIGRLDGSFQPLFVREYDFGNGHIGGVLTGLEQTTDNGYAFTVLTNARNQVQNLMVVRLDRFGNLEQERIFRHEQNLNLPYPSNNLLVKQNGDLVISRHTTDPNGNHFAEIIGMADSLRPANSFIKWRTNYNASAIHALTYHPGQDSMAIFFQGAGGNGYGLAKADGQGDIAWGAEELGSVASVSPPRRIRLKMRGSYIMSMVDNRVTYWPGNGLIPKGITNPYQGVMSDFDVQGGKVFLSANIFLNNDRFAILVKSAVSDNTGNCYTYYLQNPRFLSLSPVKRGTAPTLINILSATHSFNGSLLRDTLITQDTTLCVGAGEVWPGDANSDGNADSRDALYVGLSYDRAGPPRAAAEQDSAWRATIATNWFTNAGLVNGADRKHADCNGDGVVNRKDLRPILLNYRQMHGKNNFDPCDPGVAYPPLFLQPEKDTVEVGDTLRVWVVAGDSSLEVDSLYGLSFDLTYDMMLLDTLGVNFRPVSSWLARRDSLLWLEKDFFMNGETEIALSKAEEGIIKENSHGHGQIAYFDIFTVDDIIFKKATEYEDLHLNIQDVFAITLSETQVCFDVHADTVVLFQKGENTANAPEIISEAISIHPNPASNWLYLHTPSFPIQEVFLHDPTGRLLRSWQLSGPHHQLSLLGLAPGIYMLSGEAGGKRWGKKVVKRD